MLEIFQQEFMLRAFIAGIIIAIIAPCIGTFLVMRKYSLMADTLSHGSLAGIALGSFFGISPFLSSIITSSGLGMIIEILRKNGKAPQDAILSMILSSSLAVTAIFMALQSSIRRDIFSLLFGNIATVSWNDIWLMLLCTIVILWIMSRLFRLFFFITFDEELAVASGHKVHGYNILFIIMTAVVISITLSMIGSLLISALLVIPVMSALLIAKSFKNTLICALIYSFIAVISGIFISYYANIPSGGSIVIILVISYLFTFLLKRYILKPKII